MSTFATFHSLAELDGAEPAPPQIDSGTHRCDECRRLAYPGRDAACQAAREMGRGTVLDCSRAGCDHTVLPEEPDHVPKPPNPLRNKTSICGGTGKIRYGSQLLATSAASALYSLSHREYRGRTSNGEKNIAYPCGHCRDWHLSSDAS